MLKNFINSRLRLLSNPYNRIKLQLISVYSLEVYLILLYCASLGYICVCTVNWQIILILFFDIFMSHHINNRYVLTINFYFHKIDCEIIS